MTNISNIIWHNSISENTNYQRYDRGNERLSQGGAISTVCQKTSELTHYYQTKLIITDSIFQNNSVRQYGGALYILNCYIVILSNVTIFNNIAWQGGGIYAETIQFFTMHGNNNVISNNRAGTKEGGLIEK